LRQKNILFAMMALMACVKKPPSTSPVGRYAPLFTDCGEDDPTFCDEELDDLPESESQQEESPSENL